MMITSTIMLAIRYILRWIQCRLLHNVIKRYIKNESLYVLYDYNETNKILDILLRTNLDITLDNYTLIYQICVEAATINYTGITREKLITISIAGTTLWCDDHYFMIGSSLSNTIAVSYDELKETTFLRKSDYQSLRRVISDIYLDIYNEFCDAKQSLLSMKYRKGQFRIKDEDIRHKFGINIRNYIPDNSLIIFVENDITNIKTTSYDIGLIIYIPNIFEENNTELYIDMMILYRWNHEPDTPYRIVSRCADVINFTSNYKQEDIYNYIFNPTEDQRPIDKRMFMQDITYLQDIVQALLFSLNIDIWKHYIDYINMVNDKEEEENGKETEED